MIADSLVALATHLLVIFTAVIVMANMATLAVAAWRGLRSNMRKAGNVSAAPVSIVRPLRGLEQFSLETLESSFRLAHPNYEVIFCVASADDPVIGLAGHLIARHPHIPASLLVGDVKISSNPKLNNCITGWQKAKHELVILADSNVLMPTDYVARLLQPLATDVALVSAPPAGSHPLTTAAEWEAAFLNSFQARWQLGADAFGFGFAQGKNMLFRKSVVDIHGGIAALGSEPAEDAAATKLIHSAGWRVAVIDRPFQQPLGTRSWRDVWNRQVRWAKLRRATFPWLFALEILSGSLVPALLVGFSAAALGKDFSLAFASSAAVFYALEFAVCIAQGWWHNWRLPALCVMRDLSLPAIWMNGLLGRNFEWHGHAMSAKTVHQR